MGRSKKAPVRRTAAEEGEFLGRRQISPDLSVDLLLAHEAQEQNEAASNSETHVISIDEDEQEAIVTRSRKPKRKKTKKSVQFAAEENLFVTIEPPEIQVVFEEDDNSELETKPLLQINLRKTNADFPDKVPLKTIPLPQDTTVSVVDNEEGSARDGKMPSVIPITTSLGATDVLKICHINCSLECQSAIGRVVKDGSLLLQLSRTNEHEWQLGVFCTQKALDICHPKQLPLKRQKHAKRYRPAMDIHLALAALFPDSLLSDTAPTATNSRRASEAEPITAKQVYVLTDNVQLRAAMEKKAPSKPLETPGLIPTLRPYQVAAVEWMLQREQSPITGGEWKLAWIVLTKSAIVSLTQWEGPNANVLFICPFAGWLVRSMQEVESLATDFETARGGILAESMGLGKTVEVLACILKNPRPDEKPEVASSVQRRLDFVEETVSGPQDHHEQSESTVLVGVVEDMNEFGDAESSDEEEDGSVVAGKQADSRTCVETPEQSLVVSRALPKANPVTPDKCVESEDAEERWIEEDDLGSCICGNLITLEDCKRATVVVCSTCEEPMHMACAAFRSDEEMKRETSPRVYRRFFSNDSWPCQVLREDKRCPCCVSENHPPIESRATLIVTPPAILYQWEREIERHTKTSDGKRLRVAVYSGIDKTCKTYGPRKTDVAATMKQIHPHLLADNDIVLMTFDALMGDLGHSDDNRFVSGSSETGLGSNLRKRKRYRVIPSPLISIRWWRVCLDEAQRVETPTAGSAQMALKLESEHRWCVSGTPVGRGKLEDLYGLLLFLRMDPFAEKQWFNKCFHPSYRNVEQRIKQLLVNVFWRSTKAFDIVREQMGVPEQVEKKIFLRFSSIERHFYDRQLENTVSAAGDVAEREKSGKKRKASQIDLLAEHLHRLRAACCHPQVGSSGVSRAKKHRKSKEDRAEASVSSRVMSMDEILDRFIDDAKQKCEEAQRLAILHTNGMAAVSKLKVEAKEREVSVPETDEALLTQSCKLYLESLNLGEENSKPTLMVGEAVLSGTVGFLSPQKIVRDGRSSLEWKLPGTECQEMWTRIDFEGPARKVTQLKVRPVHEIPKHVRNETSEEFVWRLLYPKDCVFQVSSVALGGEFVDVVEFTMPEPEDHALDAWVLEGGFHTNKSKSWRLLVKTYHSIQTEEWGRKENYRPAGSFVGLEMEIYEASIASDPLQRLHCLHNASLSFSSLLKLRESASCGVDDASTFLTIEGMKSREKEMREEAGTIESLYMDVARSLHTDCHKRLEEMIAVRQKEEEKLFLLSRQAKKTPATLKDCWEDEWWDDFLTIARLSGTEVQQRHVCERLLQELDGYIRGATEAAVQRGGVLFPEFGDINGLRTALQIRMRDLRTGLGKEKARSSRTAMATAETNMEEDGYVHPQYERFHCPVGAHASCVKSILSLSSYPKDGEIWENSHCKICKADWNRQGPKCSHCKIGEQLDELSPDKVTLLVLNAIYSIVKSPLGANILKSVGSAANVEERGKQFFQLLETEKKEKLLASRLWRIHLDLLNDLDELNQCKSGMRLAFEGEDLTQLREDELNAIVILIDVNTRYHDHAAKQAMALGDLRRAKDTLRYLKNQSQERMEEEQKEKEEENCLVCLSAFDGDRAVLRCGHSFHYTPCIEKLKSPGGDVRCPLRCKIRTSPKDIMIASDKRRDDGSKIRRSVKGSWGTKVTRLVADVLDVCDLGDKCIVFSQWEDMLDIVEQALRMNCINFVRATSLRRIAECTKRFRSKDCSVLLLNVKNGGEGLTLLEATHVFMIEPLLNYGLDSQAINRIHRIGQSSKTYVHRYLIQDTIEVKIDKLRMEHQEEELEDAINEGKHVAYKAGGIDGGFRSQEELLDLLNL